jgi:hypothetical protein
MLNKQKVLRFLDIQSLVNREIEVYGQATEELVDQLEKLGDSFTSEEVSYCCEIAGS